MRNISRQNNDDSVLVVQKHFPDAIIIRNKKNIGFATACNTGARKAHNNYLLFCNPDLLVDADAVSRLLEVYHQREAVGAVSGRTRFPDGSFQPTCRNFPTAGNILVSRGSALSKLWSKSHSYTLPDYREITEVPAVAGTLMMIERELFLSSGGFDERFFMYMEDTDLCRRLAHAGYKNYCVPSAGAVHLWGKGSRASRIKRNWYHHYSVWKYFSKHFHNSFSLIILPIMLVVNFLLRVILPDLPEKSKN